MSLQTAMRSKIRFLILILIGIHHFFPGAVSGEEARTGSIQGRVIDAATAAPLAYANVLLIGTQRGTATNQRGEFNLPRVPVGRYQLQVTFVGYQPQTQWIAALPDSVLTLTFQLQEDFFQTQQIVVTATRSQKLMEAVPVVTELITREEIEEKGAENLTEIMEDRPGIAIETGSSGDKYFYMNGVDSRRILMLVDNVPISGKLNDRIQLDLIDADKIDHVEIVKGPGSALYGNEAMGGVVNIITKGYPDQLRLQTSLRTGSNALYSGALGLGGRIRNLNYQFSVDHLRQGAEKSSAEIEIKETESSRLGGKIQIPGKQLGTLEVQGEYKQDRQLTESMLMGGLSDNQARIKNHQLGLAWNRNLMPILKFQLVGYYSQNSRTYESVRRNATQAAAIDTTQDDLLGFKTDFTFTPATALKFDLGVDFSRNQYENERLSAPRERQQAGYFAQLESNWLPPLTVILGGRFDQISDLEGAFSPRLSAMYQPGSWLKFRSAWGKGFRAPSFIELYSDFPIPVAGMPLRVVGNPDLKPEKSQGGNFGVEVAWRSWLLVNTTVFYNKFENMIIDYEPKRFTYSYLNVAHAEFRGLEFQTQLYWRPNLTTTLGYNFTDIQQADEDVAFSKIAPHTASLRISWGLLQNRIKISFRDQYFSRRDILVVSGHSGAFSKAKKAAYNEIDMTLTFKLGTWLGLRVGATNLTNYRDENYGPFVGRRYFLGLQSTFLKE